MTDWALFRERIPGWQEKYMERLLTNYIQMIATGKTASSTFWALEKRINWDKKTPGVCISPTKEDMPWDLARMIKDGVITEADLDGFSQELSEHVKRVLTPMSRPGEHEG